MSDPAKDTIYIDVDDEITSIIDKVRGSGHKVVALVLPKRAATLQSIVNMKLLKKTADDQKKNIVLITSEAGLLPLAGNVGIHVAKTLQSKPEIPDAPEKFGGVDNIDDTLDVESEPTDFDSKEMADKPIGDLAGAAVPNSNVDDDETIDLGNMALAGDGIEDSPSSKADRKNKKGKKDKKLKVPDFISFRRWLLLGGLVIIVLGVGGFILLKTLSKAKITIQTNNSTVKSNLNITLDTATKTLDPANSIVPTTSQSVQKANSQQVPATGQVNKGIQASGPITVTASCLSKGFTTILQGTGVVTNDGLGFITQEDMALNNYSKDGHGNCIASGNGNITSQSGGTKYNISNNTSLTIPNYSGVTATTVADFRGGTDNIVKTVAQADIDSASKQLSAQDTTAIKLELANGLDQLGLYPIQGTFNAGTPVVTSNPALGAQSDTVTVTQTVSYTMLGVQKADLVTLVASSVNKQINDNQQNIISDGVNQAAISVLSQTGGKAQISLQSSSTVGSNIDTASLKKQIVGKKSGDVQTLIKALPGVTDVKVNFSPFWVSKVPSNQAKITMVVLNAK